LWDGWDACPLFMQGDEIVSAIRFFVVTVDNVENVLYNIKEDFILFLYSISTQTNVAYSVVANQSNYELLRYMAYNSGEYKLQVKVNEEQDSSLQWLGIAYTICE